MPFAYRDQFDVNAYARDSRWLTSGSLSTTLIGEQAGVCCFSKAIRRGHLPPVREMPEEVLKLDRKQIVVRYCCEIELQSSSNDASSYRREFV